MRAGWCDQRLHHNVQAIVAPSHGICVIEFRSQPRTKMATFVSETKENDESTFNQVAAGTVMIRYTRLTVARRTEGAKLRRRIISSQRKSTFRYFRAAKLRLLNFLSLFRVLRSRRDSVGGGSSRVFPWYLQEPTRFSGGGG